jgi:hypothetical protein
LVACQADVQVANLRLLACRQEPADGAGGHLRAAPGLWFLSLRFAFFGGFGGAPEAPLMLAHKIGTRLLCQLVEEGHHSSSQQTVAIKRAKRVTGYFTNRRQLPPRCPGGSVERRVCLEDTKKKDSSASGALRKFLKKYTTKNTPL